MEWGKKGLGSGEGESSMAAEDGFQAGSFGVFSCGTQGECGIHCGAPFVGTEFVGENSGLCDFCLFLCPISMAFKLF